MYDDEGYCVHGTYVGGCGIDWICGWCEDGISWDDYVAYCKNVRLHHVRKQAESVQEILNVGLVYGVPGMEILDLIKRYY